MRTRELTDSVRNCSGKPRPRGCFALFWGVESAYQPTVDLLGKGFRTEHLHDILDEASELGIKNYIHLMFNTPHESEEDIRHFVGLVENILIRIGLLSYLNASCWNRNRLCSIILIGMGL